MSYLCLYPEIGAWKSNNKLAQAFRKSYTKKHGKPPPLPSSSLKKRVTEAGPGGRTIRKRTGAKAGPGAAGRKGSGSRGPSVFTKLVAKQVAQGSQAITDMEKRANQLAAQAAKRAAENAKKKAAEDAARKKAAEEAVRKRAAEAEARMKAAEEARKRAAAEEARKRAAEEARKKVATSRPPQVPPHRAGPSKRPNKVAIGIGVAALAAGTLLLS